MLRFHLPLSEPDVRIARIRLSEKASRFRSRNIASRSCRFQADQPQLSVQIVQRVGIPAGTTHLVHATQSPAEPSLDVAIHGLEGFPERQQESG
jgi:hypothetical protein